MSTIKVKFYAETGEDLRKQILDFLGINPSVKSTFIALKDFGKDQNYEVDEKIKTSTQEALETIKDVSTEGISISENDAPKTKKRRTKAEIEAEKAASENIVETETSEAPDSDLNTEEAANEEATQEETGSDDVPAITKEYLTPIVIAKGREGKRAAVVALLAEFDGAPTLPTLDPKHYDAFHEKLILL